MTDRRPALRYGARRERLRYRRPTPPACVTLGQTQIQIDDRLVNLAPGMAVTAEIKTGQRRIIEYVLSPLLRYKQESLRER